ncbi:MAG: AEC family transporter [Gammaproteobacteria bacterium]
MFEVIGLILPVFAVIVAGYAAKRTGFLADGFWAPAEKLGYWVLLPSLIIQGLGTNKLPADWTIFAAAIAATVVPLSLVMLAARRLANWKSAGFASVHQGTLRLNGLLAIATCLALIGDASLPLMGILIAAWVPLSNGLSVYAYVAHRGDDRARPGQIAVEVVKNPAVFAVIIGATLNVAGLGPALEKFFLFELLGRAALPIGLLAVGAALDLSALRRPGPRVMSSLILKMLVMPALMLAICQALEASPLVTAVAIICASMPSSPSGYLVAKQLKGDHALMATIITAQTVVGMITVTAWSVFALTFLG